MPKRNKYRRGRRIMTVTELVRVLEARQYVFWGSRPTHPGWMLGLQIRYLLGEIRRGNIHYAIENGDQHG